MLRFYIHASSVLIMTSMQYATDGIFKDSFVVWGWGGGGDLQKGTAYYTECGEMTDGC